MLLDDRAFFDLSGWEGGLVLERGGDVDYETVSAGDPAEPAVRSGNGQALPSADGNSDDDYYLQFSVADDLINAGVPSTRLRIEVEYLDEGTDSFSIQYDAVAGGAEGDGRFKDTGVIVKTDTGAFLTAVFPLCDAYFANRTNGADFRIADSADGAETIRRVEVRVLPPADTPKQIAVDSCGANPFDVEPDSAAIQTCIDRACDGDEIVFTSGIAEPGYEGYQIDKTIFLARSGARRDLTVTSSNPNDHALLAATSDLAGFVVRLYARSGIGDPGYIDEVTIQHIDIDSNRAERVCYGSDNVGNGVGDNWGSWLPECTVYDDPWCSPGGLGMDGVTDSEDPEQDFVGNPERWSTGLTVRDMTLTNNECGTMLGFGGAAGTIDGVTIDTAGDHVHEPGCTATDPDEPPFAWSDGITFAGPANLITNNVIYDASDIGIVMFGGRDTTISNNTIIARPGNNGMFGGIAVHPYGWGLVSGIQVIGNTIVNEADTTCGGIHTGIDIGTHMWNAGCTQDPMAVTVGTPGACSSTSSPPGWVFCTPGQACRTWGYVPPGETFTVADNTVTGAQVSYLIEGLDVQGDLVVSGNVSSVPRMTDWEADAACTWDGITDSWGTHDFVAHDPSIEGWEDRRIYCER